MHMDRSSVVCTVQRWDRRGEIGESRRAWDERKRKVQVINVA